MADDLTDVDVRFRRLLDEQVKVRAEAVRQEREATRAIASLCVDARREGVTMAHLAAWVKVLDPKTDELRSISRQAVDQLVAAHEGRDRAPRRRGRARTGGIKMEAFLS